MRIRTIARRNDRIKGAPTAMPASRPKFRASAALKGAVFLAACALAACTPPIEPRGNLLDKDTVAEITPGVHTRDNVTQVLGTPSSVASFDKNLWYYIGGRTERVAFFKPEILEQQVVAIKFDEQGTVSEIRQYTLKDGKEVEMVDRETPTRGRELSFMRSFLSSVGLLSRDVLQSEPVYKGTGRQ